jgi:hypothetical protein
MEIDVKVKNGGFNAAALGRRIERWSQSALVSSVKYLHRSVRHAIRIAKKPSRPGTPPHTRRGVLKDAVASRIVNGVGYVGITPDLGSPERLSRIAVIQEYGASIPYAGKQFAVGQVGPIARGRGRGRGIGSRYRYARLRTAAQVARARNNYNEYYGAPQSTADYPERSFLRPTLDKVFPIVMQKFFKQS